MMENGRLLPIWDRADYPGISLHNPNSELWDRLVGADLERLLALDPAADVAALSAQVETARDFDYLICRRIGELESERRRDRVKAETEVEILLLAMQGGL